MSGVGGDAIAVRDAVAQEASAPAAPARRPRMAHVPALDGLRALAVLAVLLFHGGYLRGGWLGVDLFFVLSGYLITSLLLLEHRDRGRIHKVAFWGRRARRILPALLAMVAAVALYARWRVAAVDLGHVRRDGLSTLSFVANWHDILQGASYWDRGLSPSWFAHAWSLAVEEQMYLVWPLLVAWVLGRRRGRPPEAVARLALVVAGLSAALQLGLGALGASHERIYLGTDTRAVAVALGAFVAGWRRREGAEAASVARRQGWAVAAGAGLALLWWGLEGTSSTTYRGGLLLASCLAAVLVAGAADRRSRALGAVLGVAPLRYVGRISYGLYLWHWPLFLLLTEQRTGLAGPALLGVRLAVTFAVATTSWYLLERQVLALRPRGWWSGGRGAATAVVAIAATAALVVACTAGAQEVDTAGLADGVVRSSGLPADAPRVVVLGDSVAASLAKPAIARPRSYGIRVTRSTVLGCQAVWSGGARARGLEGDITTPKPCPPGIRPLVRREQPDAVLVTYGGWADAEYEIGGRWTTPCDPAYDAALRARLDQVLADAGSTGAKVVLAGAARSTNTFRPAKDWEHTACANRVAKAAATAAGADYLDLDAWLCPGGRCREEADGMFLRSDGVHFQGPGGATASRWVLGQVADRAGFALAEEGGLTEGDRAVRSVCRSFEELQEVTRRFGAAGMGDPQGAALLDEALGRLTPDVLGLVPPATRADLAPLADAGLRARIDEVLARAAKGETVTFDDAGPGTIDLLDRAFKRMRMTC